MPRDDGTRVIGYFAYTPPMHAICDGDACVIAGSEAEMKRYVEAKVSGSLKGTRIKKTRFGEILKGLELGAAYAFDEEAYNRFHPFAKKAGLHMTPQDFSGPSPTGMHFVRIQLAAVT
jgi:hypothetical protein